MKLKPEQLEQAFSTLKALPLFKGCKEDQIRQLAANLEAVSFTKGKVILMEQEISRTLYVLTQGVVTVWRREGGVKKRLATLKAVDFFGEMSMFTEAPANALVKAEEDCQMLALARASFDSVAQNDPSMVPAVRAQVEELKKVRPPLFRVVLGEE